MLPAPATKSSNGAADKVIVAVRMRESTKPSEGAPCLRMTRDACELQLPGKDGAPSGARTNFRFDRCFWSSRRYASGNPVPSQAAQEAEEAAQPGVYQGVGYHVLHHVTAGHNACLVTYGATGSGKSYTAFGPALLGTSSTGIVSASVVDASTDSVDSDRGGGDDAGAPNEAGPPSSSRPSELVSEGSEAGLVPRMCRDLLEAVAAACRAEGSDLAASLRVSVLEVLNEQVFDLTTANRRRLEVHEAKAAAKGGGPGGGFFAEGADKRPVKTESEAARLLAESLARRTVASHSLNDASSRAHTLVVLEFRRRIAPGRYRASRATIADLAGNERVAVAKSLDSKAMLEQAKHINLSLLTLGTCISVIVSRMQSGLPQGVVTQFRNSTLTKLLKDSIVGNSHLSLLCTVAPSSATAAQTLHTLRFADAAKHLECRHLALAHVERDGQVYIPGENGRKAPADGELPQLAQARAAVGRSAGKRRRTTMAVQVVRRLAGVYERQERSHRASVVIEQAQAWSSVLARAKVFFGALAPPSTTAAVGGGGRKPLYPASLSTNSTKKNRSVSAAPAMTPRPPPPRAAAKKQAPAAPPRRSVVSFVAATPSPPPMKPKPPPAAATTTTKTATAPRRHQQTSGDTATSITTTTTTYRVDAAGSKTVVGTTTSLSAATTTTTTTRTKPASNFSSSPALDRVQAALRKEAAREAKARRDRCATDEHKGRSAVVSAEARVRSRLVSGEKEIRAKVLKEQGLRTKQQRRPSALQWAVASPTTTTTSVAASAAAATPYLALRGVWNLARDEFAEHGCYTGVAVAAQAAGIVRITTMTAKTMTSTAGASLVTATSTLAPAAAAASETPSPRSISGYADDDDFDDSAAVTSSIPPTPRSEPLSEDGSGGVRSPTPPPLSRSPSIRSPTPHDHNDDGAAEHIVSTADDDDDDDDDEVASHVASSRPLTATSSIPPTPSPVESVAAVESDHHDSVASSVPASPAAASSRAASSIPPTPSPPPPRSSASSPAPGDDNDDDDPYGDDDFDGDVHVPEAVEHTTPRSPAAATAGASAKASALVGLAGVADADAIRAQLEADERAERERVAAERALKAARVGPASDEVRPIAPVEGSDDVLDACDVFQSIETPEALGKVAVTMTTLANGGAASVVLNTAARDALRATIVSALGAGDSDVGSEAEAAMIAATLELFATLKHIDHSAAVAAKTTPTSNHPLVAEWCAEDEWLDTPMLSTTATSWDARPLAAVLALIDGTPDVHRSATAEWGLALARRVAAAPVSVHSTEPRSALPVLLGGGGGGDGEGALFAAATPSVVSSAVWCSDTAPMWADAVRALAVAAPPYTTAEGGAPEVAEYVRALRRRFEGGGGDVVAMTSAGGGDWNGYDAVL